MLDRYWFGEVDRISPEAPVPVVRVRACEERLGGGYAFPDNVGFTVSLPHRESFSPDAAFYTGELCGGEASEITRSGVMPE